ncbi:CheY-like chemotaxis protein [Gillisia sp. Hel_I_86]|uniref:response regulator n=1 Tax=Gillisia sp. Hel_I_86 TaxID=1249981 RepID=UPI00119A298E|nr:response regulator [Gillisia sp. Hel_I_86]TVZ26919.1 CheY-like chemotaxis protein [Gillisia sp. Hel_I_86]
MENQPQKFKIIIIDDDYLTTMLHHKKLVQNEMTPVTPIIFNDPREALTYFSHCCTSKTTYIILLDLEMPYLNGIELLRRLKRLKKKIKTLDFFVFILSSVIDSTVIKSLREYPEVRGYYNKPFSDNHCSHLKNKIHAFKNNDESVNTGFLLNG